MRLSKLFKKSSTVATARKKSVVKGEIQKYEMSDTTEDSTEYLQESLKTVTIYAPNGRQARARGEALLNAALVDGGIVETLIVQGDRLEFPQAESDLTPLLSFLKMSPSLQTLSLSTLRNCTLNCLLKAALVNPMLEEIHLEQIFLTHETFIFLLENSISLKRLSMSRLRFETHTSVESGKHLIQAFQSNTSLLQVEIGMVQSTFQETVFAPIALGIQASPSIQQLELFDCRFDPDCTVLFQDVMTQKTSNLQRLRLRNNVKFTSNNQATVVSEMLTKKPTESKLEEMRVLYSDVQDDIGKFLKPLQQRKKNTSAFVLDCLTIDSDGNDMKGLSSEIPKIRRLRKLCLNLDGYSNRSNKQKFDEMRENLIDAFRLNFSLQEVVIRGDSNKEKLEQDQQSVSIFCKRNICVQKWLGSMHSIPEEYSAKLIETLLQSDDGHDNIFGLLKLVWAER